MTTDELYLLVAETRCEHGRLPLHDAVRTGDDWTAFLRAPALPGPFAVRDFHAFQALAPQLPATWIVPPPAAPAARGALTLPDLALILADALEPDPSPWRLHAIHRTRPAPSHGSDGGGSSDGDSDGDTYLIELVDPATADVRLALTLAAYHQARRPPPAPVPPSSLPLPTR